MTRRVLIVGGYGTFGLRAAERLAGDPNIEIVLAGRDLARSAEATQRLSRQSKSHIRSATLDASKPDIETLRALNPTVVFNASGPFQTQSDYALARAAIAVGAHYIDLADARAFVAGFHVLDADAKAAGVLAVSGASSVPGLSSAVLDHYLPAFKSLDSLTFGIVPANGFDPGVATTESILSYVGKPFDTLRDGRMIAVRGWQDIWRHRFPGIGPRWLANCDVPDLALFPARYPTLRSIRFSAGLEVPLMHFGLWGLSWLARLGALPRPERLARPLLRMKGWMSRLGSSSGGMFVLLDGIGHDDKPKHIAWHVIAHDNQGPFIPPTPAIILTRKLLAGQMPQRGAMPCLGLMTLAEFQAAVPDLAISFAEI